MCANRRATHIHRVIAANPSSLLVQKHKSSAAVNSLQADNQDRDVDLYHWSSAKFASTWRDTLSVLVARGRAQVGVHSAKTDWSRRILDFQYMDYDDQAAHHA